MSQELKRKRLIEHLLKECGETSTAIPEDEFSQKRLLRALLNVRMPMAASEDFLRLQDEYLQEELRRKGIADIEDMIPVVNGLYLWQGDITTLKCDGIVNAANSAMLGCFCPNHNCIDNAIHTYAGVQLRQECANIMQRQGYEEPTGQAKMTAAYNLPCKYVLHTVGPIVLGKLTQTHERQLADCYRACLALADKKLPRQFGVLLYIYGRISLPRERAAQIAVNTVKDYKKETDSKIKVIFNVFKDCDHEIYARLLGANTQT